MMFSTFVLRLFPSTSLINSSLRYTSTLLRGRISGIDIDDLLQQMRMNTETDSHASTPTHHPRGLTIHFDAMARWQTKHVLANPGSTKTLGLPEPKPLRLLSCESKTSGKGGARLQ
jgi:hypothetical protein